jgi:hypothetical protein
MLVQRTSIQKWTIPDLTFSTVKFVKTDFTVAEQMNICTVRKCQDAQITHRPIDNIL